MSRTAIKDAAIKLRSQLFASDPAQAAIGFGNYIIHVYTTPAYAGEKPAEYDGFKVEWHRPNWRLPAIMNEPPLSQHRR